MTDLTIEHADDPRLADYARLTDPPFRMADEARRGYFVVESVEPLRVALGAVDPGRIRSVLVTPEQRLALADRLDSPTGFAGPVFIAERRVLREIVGFDLHRGALAAVDRVPLPSLAQVLGAQVLGAPVLGAQVLGEARLVAVGEGLNDHENLGSLFRNAAAFGVDAIVLDSTCADPWYRRSVRVSIGHVLTVPWTVTDSIVAAVAAMRAASFVVVGLTPDSNATPLRDFAAGRPERVAVLVGAEGPGLTDESRRACDVEVRIPMRHGVDSVNVATAASIAFYELTSSIST